MTAQGDASNSSAYNQRFFTLTYTGPAGASLLKAKIDIGPSSEDFDETIDNGYPFTIGLAQGVSSVGVTSNLTADTLGVPNSLFKVIFPAGNFPSGGTFAFGIDRDNDVSHINGNDADLLAGSTVTPSNLSLAMGRGKRPPARLKTRWDTATAPTWVTA